MADTPLSVQALETETPDLVEEPVNEVDGEGQPVVIDPNAPAALETSEEDELDELIIEDFTIDGICGVY
jgi:mycofactocin precursor